MIEDKNQLVGNIASLASEIITSINTKLPTIFSVVVNTSLDGVMICTITFKVAINSSNGGAKASVQNKSHMLHPIP